LEHVLLCSAWHNIYANYYNNIDIRKVRRKKRKERRKKKVEEKRQERKREE